MIKYPAYYPADRPIKVTPSGGGGGAEVVLEPFEAFSGNIPTGALTWEHPSTAPSLVASGLYVTQGSFSGEFSESGGAGSDGIISYGNNLSLYSKIRVDVTVTNLNVVGNLEAFRLYVEDEFDAVLDTTTGDTLGSWTLEVDITSLSDLTDVAIQLSSVNSNGFITAYIDNLRGVT